MPSPRSQLWRGRIPSWPATASLSPASSMARKPVAVQADRGSGARSNSSSYAWSVVQGDPVGRVVLAAALNEYASIIMPSGTTRARVTSCCSLVIRISAASRSLFNAGSDWVGSCAITIRRRRDRTPKVRSRNPDSANPRPAILTSRKSSKSRKPLCYRRPNSALRLARSPCQVQVLPPFQFFDHTGDRNQANGTVPRSGRVVSGKVMCTATTQAHLQTINEVYARSFR